MRQFKDKIICPRSHGKLAAELELEPWALSSLSCLACCLMDSQPHSVELLRDTVERAWKTKNSPKHGSADGHYFF
jgi:hypothetical protein